jgi:hypothetical protein
MMSYSISSTHELDVLKMVIDLGHGKEIEWESGNSAHFSWLASELQNTEVMKYLSGIGDPGQNWAINRCKSMMVCFASRKLNFLPLILMPAQVKTFRVFLRNICRRKFDHYAHTNETSSLFSNSYASII